MVQGDADTLTLKEPRISAISYGGKQKNKTIQLWYLRTPVQVSKNKSSRQYLLQYLLHHPC